MSKGIAAGLVGLIALGIAGPSPALATDPAIAEGRAWLREKSAEREADRRHQESEARRGYQMWLDREGRARDRMEDREDRRRGAGRPL